MRKYLLPSALVLAFGLSLAAAQNITKSLQGSQDSRGPVGLDSSNNAYFPAHILDIGPPPVLSSCGTTPSIVGSDFSGQITEGTTATGCTVTFASAYAAAPGCVISTSNAASALAVTTSTTAMTITHSSYSGVVVSYICSGTK